MSISHDEILPLYRSMLRIRLIEERIATLYAEQAMRCPVHLCIGQEAVAVGVCSALHIDDYVLSTHRAHGHYLAKGGDLRALFAELYGKATGCSGGIGGSMHLIDVACGFLGCTPIVGSTLPIAVGTAWAAQCLGEARVTVVFFGEGATEEGVFSESLNFAALKSLPIIFVCENNLYSVYSPLAVRQAPGRDLPALARAHGVPGTSTDGNDLLLVREATQSALLRARQHHGPTVLEFSTYRWKEHCGPNFDNDIGYRTPEEFAQWQARCPLARTEQWLHARVPHFANEKKSLTTTIHREIDDAIAAAQSSAFPEPAALYANIYAPARTGVAQ